MTSIDEVLGRVEAWRGREVSAIELSGGLTNTNHLVTGDGDRWVVRIPGRSTELLAVDRENERYNAAAAATTGVAPAIVEVLEDLDVMVIEYVDGTTMSAGGPRTPHTAPPPAPPPPPPPPGAGVLQGLDKFPA